MASEAVGLGANAKPSARNAVMDAAEHGPLREHCLDGTQRLLSLTEEALGVLDEIEGPIDLKLGLRSARRDRGTVIGRFWTGRGPVLFARRGA